LEAKFLSPSYIRRLFGIRSAIFFSVARGKEFLRKMAQPYDKAGSSISKTLLSQEDVEKMSDANLNEMLY
jgi:hypothetical protein